MADLILVSSVMHTGTRFLVRMLHRYSVPCRQIHTLDEKMKDIEELGAKRAAIPLRDPALCCVSHYNKPGFKTVPEICDFIARQWDNLIEIEETMDHVHLRLDADDTLAEAQKVLRFCGCKKEIKEYPWFPVRNGYWPTADYATWDEIKHEAEALTPYRERYNYG